MEGGTYWVFGSVEEDERDYEEGCEAHREEGEKSERVGTFGFECTWLDRSPEGGVEREGEGRSKCKCDYT